MRAAHSYSTHLNGREATAAELQPLAFAGFAHFSAMQVRDSRVRGLDLHLERLAAASETLFGRSLPNERVRGYLRAATEAGPSDLSLTVTMFSRMGEFTRTGAHDDPAVLVRTGPASDGPPGPLRLALAKHERWLPAIKLVGESAKTLLLREAVRDGFDDAAFLDRSGRISEGTIWNLAFWDGDTVVWLEADMLAAITMQIVKRQLAALGVPQRVEPVTLKDVERMHGAAVMNSWTPGVTVIACGTAEIPPAERFISILHRAYAREPAQPL